MVLMCEGTRVPVSMFLNLPMYLYMCVDVCMCLQEGVCIGPWQRYLHPANYILLINCKKK